ncbi:MAG: hypothetical protein RL661_160, partial [Pseudomonadota bacterium]
MRKLDMRGIVFLVVAPILFLFTGCASVYK